MLKNDEIIQGRLEHKKYLKSSWQKTYDKAISGKSKSCAIRSKCHDCSRARSEIADCAVSSCPLWPYRPYQSGIRKLKLRKLKDKKDGV